MFGIVGMQYYGADDPPTKNANLGKIGHIETATSMTELWQLRNRHQVCMVAVVVLKDDPRLMPFIQMDCGR